MEQAFLPKEYFYAFDVDVQVRVKVVLVEGTRPREKLQVLLDDPFRTSTTLATVLPPQQQQPQLPSSSSSTALSTIANGVSTGNGMARGVADVSASDKSELFVVAQIFANNKPLTPPIRTGERSMDQNGRWEEWLNFPIKIADLPQTAQLCMTVWDLYGPQKYVAVGGTSFRLFTKQTEFNMSMLKEGKHKLFLWPNREADGAMEPQTPSEAPGSEDVSQIHKIMKKFDDGEMPRVEWLDKLITEVHMGQLKASAKSDQLYLHVQLVKFDLPVLWEERLYDVPNRFPSNIAPVKDPEALFDSPVDAKHIRLSRAHRSSPADRDLRPNISVRNQLAKVISYPPTVDLSEHDRDLVWQFRFYLSREKNALVKFLKSVYWEEKEEEKQALDLMEKWAPMDPDRALELLSPTFTNKSVRAYAVSRLRLVDDEELQLFFLQLVQALKYENLLQQNIEDSALASFLIERAIQSPILDNFLYWYLKVETEDPAWHEVYKKMVTAFMERLLSNSGKRRYDVLEDQIKLLNKIDAFQLEISSTKLERTKKIERLKALLADPKLLDIKTPISLPLDPTVKVVGIRSDNAHIYKSAKLPLFLTFLTDDNKEYSIVYKYGDDLRQDQLVIQIIQLMDRLLRKEKLDLQLTPYKVLATAGSKGMIQYVNAEPLSKILDEYNNDIQAFFRKHNYDANAPYQIAPQVMDTYIKSCAGYCVITFLLGVGDRHLENLLLATSGHLFHIDFGFILGKDPKIFPPPMKLSYEMVQCMGGVDSPEATRFRSYCYLAFNALRKSANLIINLFSLMVDSNVHDIRDDRDKAVYKVLENFQLNKSDEEAIAYFRDLINTSLNSMMPQMMENMHKVAQYFRR